MTGLTAADKKRLAAMTDCFGRVEFYDPGDATCEYCRLQRSCQRKVLGSMTPQGRQAINISALVVAWVRGEARVDGRRMTYPELLVKIEQMIDKASA